MRWSLQVPEFASTARKASFGLAAPGVLGVRQVTECELHRLIERESLGGLRCQVGADALEQQERGLQEEIRMILQVDLHRLHGSLWVVGWGGSWEASAARDSWRKSRIRR